MAKSRITIVTVCRNAESTIESTIKSVIEQTYTDIEYIIIDGCSSDGTLDIINKYKNNIDIIVSEPDKGIYDAMNKAVRLATGEWINFMNSGDSFFDSDVIFNVFNNKDYNDIGVIYGNVKHICTWGEYELIPSDISMMSYRTPFCHQSSFIRTSLMKEKGYDISYRFAADYNFFFNCWKKGIKFKYISNTVSIFDSSIGSFSANNPKAVRAEEKKIASIKESLYFKLRVRDGIARVLFSLPFISKYLRIKSMSHNPLIRNLKYYD